MNNINYKNENEYSNGINVLAIHIPLMSHWYTGTILFGSLIIYQQVVYKATMALPTGLNMSKEIFLIKKEYMAKARTRELCKVVKEIGKRQKVLGALGWVETIVELGGRVEK